MVTIGQYTLAGTLGVGTFGKVKLAEHYLTGEKVAIKIINKLKMETMNMHEKIRREITILQLLKHPHVIRLYELLDTPSDLFMVMEYVAGGELFDHIVHKLRLRESEARRFFQQIISGVEYCHMNMVVHRDLKPENLLLDTNLHVKIADFGLSNRMRNGEFLKTSCGSPNYASPEVVSGKAYAGPEVDVWSCGVVLYALLCGSLPFDDENVPNLFRKIKHGNFTLPGHLTNEAKDLIVQMLVVDPTKRINFPQIRSHKWFKVNLPDYLCVGPVLNASSSSSQELDSEIIREMSDLGMKLGEDKSTVSSSSAKSVQTLSSTQQATPKLTMDDLTSDERVVYSLLINRRSKRSSFTDLLPLSQKHANMPPLLFATEDTVQHIRKEYGYDKIPPIIPAATGSAHRGPHTINIPQNVVSQTWGPSTWRLGLEFSMESNNLNREVFSVLRTNDYEWAIITPWRFRCRKLGEKSSSRKNEMQFAGGSTDQTSDDSATAARPSHDEEGGGKYDFRPLDRGPPDRGKNNDEDVTLGTTKTIYTSENLAVQVQVYKITTGRYLVDLMQHGSGATLPSLLSLINLMGALMKSPILSQHLITQQTDSTKRIRHR